MKSTLCDISFTSLLSKNQVQGYFRVFKGKTKHIVT